GPRLSRLLSSAGC
nr:Chain C, Aldehyde dehydrogenase, mitochondrial [Rattus norvegicus]3AWR_D Chain D, Aldehyde dehydrogenase, mitochondrial [Rattus norvegicus]